MKGFIEDDTDDTPICQVFHVVYLCIVTERCSCSFSIVSSTGGDAFTTIQLFQTPSRFLSHRKQLQISGYKSFLPTKSLSILFLLLQIAVAWKPVVKRLGLWKIVRSLARLYDAGMGMIIFVPIAICSWFPFISTFQTRLLFNQAFSRGLEISLILAGNNQNAGI